MQKIILSRRAFVSSLGTALKSTLGSGLILSSFHLNAFAVNHHKDNTIGLASAASGKNNQHWLAIFDTQGKLSHQIALPDRAHQITQQPGSFILAIAARRPGTYLMIVDSQKGEIIQHIQSEKGHHFYGHTSYSLDGRYLYTTENDIESGEGRIVVRDANDKYQVINSFSSHGIGPHEIKVHPDGETLVVANGGILTHPEAGRAKLNLDTMSPSLVYLSSKNGELLEQRTLPKHLHQLSIRHISINNDGFTAVAMQYQGNKLDNVPLVAVHKRGQPLKTLWAPEHINRGMKQYCGSVCFNQSGSIFAITSPRGNLLTLWDAIDGEYITQFRCADVCGVSQFGQHGFSFSNGLGKLYTFDMNSSLLKLVQKENHHQLSWDNHLTSLI